MRGTHSTAVQKFASDILESNSLQPQIFGIADNMQPTIAVEPYIDVVQVLNSAGTIYTTPSDKEFFLTNIYLSGITTPSSTAGEVEITFTPSNGNARTIRMGVPNPGVGTTVDIGGEAHLSILFPLRGVKLQKNTTITLAFTVDSASSMIAGYLGSDRS